MKQLMTLVLVCASVCGMAQSYKADDVLGTWLTSSKEGKIAIYKTGTKYSGKIQSGSSKEHFDVHNPEPARRKDSLIGLVLLKDFAYDGDGKWTDGTIYDPKSGKTYSCNMTLTDRNTLKIRGYIGISLLGRTEVWTRVQ
ncbi:DUF2147 domain-containing protein [Paraflavitalea pollutisoli]|uniref:DUF2147 domain-containing protein n=1 Tax=Paraflavitalea pollutisoli TaxID=3034143 RepID=UPI0023EDFBA2|nr:DUF2147 domain-containing protein [Paraflavitalea sp. H1-2-19X]